MPRYNVIAWDNGNKIYWNLEGSTGINFVNGNISVFMQKENIRDDQLIQQKEKLTYTEANIILGDNYFASGDVRTGKDFHSYTFSVPQLESDGKVRMFRIGAVEYTEIKAYPDEIAELIEKGIARLLTEQERSIPYPRIQIITISTEVQAIINKFENNDYLIPSGVNVGIELVKNGTVSSDVFLQNFNNLLQTGIISDKTIQPEPTPTPTYDFIIESDGKVRMFRIGAVEYTEIKVFPDNVQSYIDKNIGRLLTAQERAIPYPRPEPEPEKTFCVNTYNIRDSGSVYSTHYESITAQKVEELQQTQYVVSCSATTLPTEKQVQDFYGFTPLPPTVDTSINETMVSQSVGAFILKEGIVKGEILYIANESFNSFYYGKNLTSLVQIKSKTGTLITIKQNNLNFTQTERDERIYIDENVGNYKELTIDFFVWDSAISALKFASTKQIQVVEELPQPDPFDPKPPSTCQIGYHKNFSGKCVPDDPPGELPRDKLIDTIKGFLFGTVALSLLARKY